MIYVLVITMVIGAIALRRLNLGRVRVGSSTMRVAGYLLIDRKRAGFTLFEICVALVILAVAVLGISASAGQLASLSAGAESRAVALEAVNDRLSLIQLSQNYAALDSVFTSTEPDNPQVGMTRVTDLVRTRTAMPNGQFIDYTTITVTVSGPEVTPAISRSLIVGAR